MFAKYTCFYYNYFKINYKVLYIDKINEKHVNNIYEIKVFIILERGR